MGAIISGKYRLLERLGGGGMGDVYRAEHTLAGRVVAFKLLREEFAEDEDFTRRFFQEAQAVNRIRHPNIVDVLDAGFSDEGPYVVMECLEGLSLSAALARLGRLDAAAALSVIMPMLDALDAAHRHGIVHRDLKPENVFVSLASDGHQEEVRIKILDFGIAKVMDGADDTVRPRTHTGIIFGTPDYLSPEQASGDRVVDGRSDIFSVGTVLFELLTGHRPFSAKSAVATAYRVVHEAPARLSEMGVKADPLLQSALDVALAKRPEERFVNAAAFADMLAPLVPDGPTRRRTLRAMLDTAVAAGPSKAASTHVPRDAIRNAPAEASGDALRDPQARVPITSHPPDAPTSRELEVAPTLAAFGRDLPLSTPMPIPRSLPTPYPAAPRESASIVREDPRPRAPTLEPATPRAPTLAKTASTSGIWAPRPLPAHAKGRCHVRGTFPRAVGRWIERAYGAESRDLVLSRIPSEHAEYFLGDAFNALVWYELEPIDMFMEAATVVVMSGSVHLWRVLAREQFDKDLGPILRPPHRVVDPLVLVRKAPAAWARIFDFGTARVAEPSSSDPMRVVVRVDGFEATSLAIRYAMLGTMEGMLRGAGATDVGARITAGDGSFARDFEYELSWR